ncbi:MAG: IclR family transcriptional regulator [Thermoleophilia bacterium]
MTEGYGRQVPAVEQTTRVLYHLASVPSGDATLTEICRAVDIHLSKGHAILATLRSAGLVVRKDQAKLYSLGPGVLTLARSLLDRTGLATAAEPYLAEAAAATECTALLGLITAGRVFIVARRETPGAAVGVTIRVGHRYPLGWGAHGRAIAAFMPPERRAVVLGGAGVSVSTADLDEVRSRGFAADIGGMQAGVSAVSAPVLDARGEPAAALILVGTFPADLADTHGRRAAAAARAMSVALAPYLETGS